MNIGEAIILSTSEFSQTRDNRRYTSSHIGICILCVCPCVVIHTIYSNELAHTVVGAG